MKIGTEGAYPPFNNLTADGKLEGFDIDIANALCAEMKVTCEFVTQDWDGIIPALQAGKFDAIIASMSITPERAEKVDFTNKYYNTPSAIAGPKDSTIPASLTKADLAGKTIGVATSQLVEAILRERPHPEHGYRSCLGILRLAKRYGEVRLEAACARAMRVGARSFRHVDSILKNGLDHVVLVDAPTIESPLDHENVRGGAYYQ